MRRDEDRDAGFPQPCHTRAACWSRLGAEFDLSKRTGAGSRRRRYSDGYLPPVTSPIVTAKPLCLAAGEQPCQYRKRRSRISPCICSSLRSARHVFVRCISWASDCTRAFRASMCGILPATVGSVPPRSSRGWTDFADPRIRPPECGRQAARTVARNFATSALRLLLSLDSDCAEASTWAEAEPVSPAPRLTSVMLVATCAVPVAA
jgi:hypothetical protein